MQSRTLPTRFSALLQRGMLLTALLILPTSICLGAAFPLALSLAGDPAHSPARRFGLVYAVNTVGSVTGTLAAGFVLIPWLGLPTTLAAAAFVLVIASIATIVVADVSPSSPQRRVRRLCRRSGRDRRRALVGPRVAGQRRLPVCAVRSEEPRPRDAAQGRNASLLPGWSTGHRIGEAAHRDDHARGRRQGPMRPTAATC
jgi:MFS family permease